MKTLLLAALFVLGTVAPALVANDGTATPSRKVAKHKHHKKHGKRHHKKAKKSEAAATTPKSETAPDLGAPTTGGTPEAAPEEAGM